MEESIIEMLRQEAQRSERSRSVNSSRRSMSEHFKKKMARNPDLSRKNVLLLPQFEESFLEAIVGQLFSPLQAHSLFPFNLLKMLCLNFYN